MAQPMSDPIPIPPELEPDPPLSDEVLERLDEAFAAAYADTGGSPDAIAAIVAGADPLEDEGAPAAARLIPDAYRREWLTDDGAAEWAMRHVAQIDVELRSLAERRDEWADRIDHWFAQASRRLIHRRSMFVAHLLAYGAARREADPKAPKTLNLPSGRITSQDRKPALKVVDDAALAEWLRERELLVAPDGSEIVRTTTKVYVSPLGKVLDVAAAGAALVVVPTAEVIPTTELPPGLAVEPAHTVYDVKPA